MSSEAESLVSRKQGLRRALLERRKALSELDVHAWSARLGAELTNHWVWKRAGGLAAFVGARGEPETMELLRAALEQRKSVWLPRVVPGAKRLSFVCVTDLAVLVPGAFGLVEPCVVTGEQTIDVPGASSGIDVVLVPGVAFMRDGARLGMGMGFYDRALEAMRDSSVPLRVGLCFSSFLDPPDGPIPVGAKDVRMHYVATEAGVVDCG